jgi:hypothetical protein
VPSLRVFIDRRASVNDAGLLARVCLGLLALVDAADCWMPTGPAPGVHPLSLRGLLLLSPPRLEAVGELLAAIARGPAAIDAWLERYPPAQHSPPSRAQSRAAAAGRSKLTRLVRSR